MFILVLAGGMLATGAAGQGAPTGTATATGTAVATGTAETAVATGTAVDDGDDGAVEGDDDGDGAADDTGGGGEGGGVALARTGFPVAIFVLVGSVLLAAGFAGRGRRKS